MGIDPGIKKFLYLLFPNCFTPEINIAFNVTLMDITHNLAAKILQLKQGQNETIERLLISLKHSIYNLMTNDTTDGPNFQDFLVLFLDNPFHVPGNKSFTQKKRDDKGENKSYMNEEDYIKFKASNNCLNDVLFPYTNSNINIDGVCLWRDLNLRNRLNHLVSRELLKLNLKGYESKKIIIDDGLFLSSEEYSKKCHEILYRWNMDSDNHSDYEKDTLISLEMVNEYRTALLYRENDASKVVYDFNKKIGESDCKMLSYIKRDENNSNYLVISSDGDMLFFLLLHMKSIIHPTKLTFNNQVYIDCRSLYDSNNKIDRDYRYINVTKLYQSMIELFEKDYNGINHPVELFVFLFLSYYSDYNNTLPKSLSIGPTKIWNTFSYLHCTNKDGYIPYSIDYKKDRVKNAIALNPIKYILNDAIIIDPYDMNYDNLNEFGSKSSLKNLGFFTNYFVISFDKEKIQKFFCFLFQQNSIPKKFNILQPIYDYNELFNHVHNFKVKQNLCNKNKKTNQIPNNNTVIKAYNSLNNISNNKENIVKAQELDYIRLLNNKNKSSVDEITNLLNNCETDVIDESNDGLLSFSELNNRINMLTWIMNYFQNGWKSDDFSQSYHFTDNKTKKSKSGWKLVPYDSKNDIYPISSNYIVKIIDYFGPNTKFPKSIYDIYKFYTVQYTNT